ncbi:MAG TPA: winged helix-turn-helix transcriptional regulator [Candidatus Nanoarchaeia archaeon]|nr:winged helix-turn-helix transcriptional regulator [Candidatus Nanoarchaeia archaeon]
MPKVDHSFVYCRTENARVPLKEIANHLKKSPQRLKYNTSILEKEKIIHAPYCMFDYSYFGLILFHVYFKGGYVGEKDKTKIINELLSNQYITTIYELTGEFDLAVDFLAPNPSKFNKELKKMIGLLPTLNDYKIALNVVSYVYPRNYLTKNQKLHGLYVERLVGGDKEREKFTETELAVIKSLLKNPVIRYSHLAQKTSLNVKTVKSTIKSLTKRNVIKGFKYNLNKEKLGIAAARLFLKLHNVSSEREQQLMEFMSNTLEIVQLNKTVGDWDIEFDLEAVDKNGIRSILIQLRQEFKDLIERFNLIELNNCHKKSYLPEYIFPEDTTV